MPEKIFANKRIRYGLKSEKKLLYQSGLSANLTYKKTMLLTLDRTGTNWKKADHSWKMHLLRLKSKILIILRETFWLTHWRFMLNPNYPNFILSSINFVFASILFKFYVLHFLTQALLFSFLSLRVRGTVVVQNQPLYATLACKTSSWKEFSSILAMIFFLIIKIPFAFLILQFFPVINCHTFLRGGGGGGVW